MSEVARLRAENERLESENGELRAALVEATKIFKEQVIPVLTQVVDTARGGE